MTDQLTGFDISEILYARGYAYDILRRFFIEEPTREYLKLFVQNKMYENFPFSGDVPGISEGIKDIDDYFKKYNPAENKDDFEELHWDYTRMLVGPLKLPAPPWESVYVRKDKLLFQETTLKVRRKYRKYGFTSSELGLEAEDHIGLELDFMYHLNNLSLKIAREQNESAGEEMKELLLEQQKFLNEHLLAFALEFADKMAESAETRFYQGMAKVLKGFLPLDSKVLSELLNIDCIH